MTNTPEHTAAAAAVTAVDELEPLRQLAGLIQGLTVTLIELAGQGDAVNTARTAEQLLPLHSRFAELYRTWLVRRTAGQPPFIPLGCPDSMST